MKMNPMVSTVVATALLSTAMLYAEPGNFGVNGENAWRSIEQKRVKHTDDFGDTYYTYSAAKPKKFIEKEMHQHRHDLSLSPQTLVDAFTKTLQAVSLLHERKSNEAIALLQTVNQQLKTALKEHPEQTRVLVAQEITVAEYLGDSAQLEKAITLAERLLKEHSTQSAREIVMRLQDALIVDNTYLSVKAYARTIAKTLALLEDGVLLQKDEHDAALLMLNMALHDMIHARIIVPIPFLKAHHLVIAASTLDTSKHDTVNAYLDEAQEELKRAILLGYIKETSSDYKMLEGEIHHIQQALKDHRKSTTLYDRIKKAFKKLLHQTRHKIIQSNAEAKVNTYERQEDTEALQKRKIFEKEAVEDEHKLLGTTP